MGDDSTDPPSNGGTRSRWIFRGMTLDEALGRLVVDGHEVVLDHSTHLILLHLLRHAGEVVTKNALLEAGWPGRVATESSLTKAIHRLRHALGDTDSALIATVHGYGYQFAGEATHSNGAATPPAVAMAPVRPPPVSPSTGRRWLMVAAVLAISTAFVVIVSRDPRPDAKAAPGDATTAAATGATPAAASPADVRASIAVLPFLDRSPGGDQAYLSQGLAEELHHVLKGIPQLAVAPRQSGDGSLDPESAAATLDVDHVVSGTTLRTGDEVRVEVRLTRRDGFLLWSETYDRAVGQLLDMEREIATSIAGRLKLQLVGLNPRTRPFHPDAYPLILEAEALANKGTTLANERAVELYREALEVSPEEAWAWSGLGRVYMAQANTVQTDRGETLRLAQQALEKAVEIDPDDAWTYTQLASLHANYIGDRGKGAEYYQAALRLAPDDASVAGNVSVFLQSLGRIDDAIALAEFAVADAPHSGVRHVMLSIDYYYAGRFDEAIAAARKGLELSPGAGGAHLTIGTSMLLAGQDPEAALEEMRAEQDELWRTAGLVLAYHATGRKEASDEALAKFIEAYGPYTKVTVASLYAYRGEADKAFEWLEKGFDAEDQGLYYLGIEPLFWSVREDPRWFPLLRRAGASPEQLAAISFVVNRPQAAR